MAERTGYPVCPHCGYEERDEWYEYFPGNSECAEIQCPSCDGMFDAVMHTLITFTTTKSADSVTSNAAQDEQ